MAAGGVDPGQGGAESAGGAGSADGGGSRGSGGRSGGRRWGRWLLRGLGGLVLLVVAAVAFLLQAPPGQQLVVDTVLSRVDDAFAGPLTVEGVHGPGLLRGVTLVGVRLDAEGGRPFFRADSIRARWSLPGLVGERSLRSVTAWGVRVEVSQYSEEAPTNVERLLAEPAEAAPDTATQPGTPTRIGLGRVRVEDGLLEVLTPAEPDDTVSTVPAPDGEGRLSRLALEELELELAGTVLTLGGDTPLSASLEHFASDVVFLERPLVVSGAEGRLRADSSGLVVEDGRFRFPGTAMTGRVALGQRVEDAEGFAFTAVLATDGPGSLADLRWIDPRIPDGSFRGGMDVEVGERTQVVLEGVTAELEASDLSVDGRIVIDGGIRVSELQVGASPLVLARLEPWLGRSLPVEGFLTGSLLLNGTPEALRTRGRVTLVPEGIAGGPTTADLSGTLHLAGDPGVTNLELRLAPLNYGLADLVAPGIVPDGSGRATLTASGRVSRGIRFVADARYGVDTLASRVVSRGMAERDGEGSPWRLDVLTDLAPLSLELLSGLAPEAGLEGRVRGSIRTLGPLDSLRVEGRLEGGGGEAQVEATVDVDDPASFYRLEADLRGVTLSALSTRLPRPSVLTGRVELEGRNFALDSVDARAAVTAQGSRIGGLRIDSVEARVRTLDGLLTVDTVGASLGGIRVRGSGSLGLLADREGRATLQVQADTLAGLRPLFMGDTVIAADTLEVLERELLRMEGVDPDTLPDLASVSLDGRMQAEVVLQGWLRSFQVDGSAVLSGATYGMNRVDSLSATFHAEELPSLGGTLRVELDGRGLELEDRSFERVEGSLAMQDRAGEASVEVRRDAGERLVAQGDFSLDTLGGGTVQVQEARLELDTLVYESTGPARVVWDPSSLRVEGLELLREGGDPMRLSADGTLDWAGTSDFTLDVEGLQLGRVARLLQMPELELSGAVDLEVAVRGPAEEPSVESAVRWIRPRWNEVTLDSLAGTVRYESRLARVDLSAWEGGERAFAATGTVPVDVALDSAPVQVVDQPMDLRVQAEELGAANVLSVLGFLEDVEGQVSGDFEIGGTLEAPEPQGVFRLEDAAWTMEALGVRHRNVRGSLTLNPDRTVEVSLRATAAGSVEVSGTVTLEPLADPSLELDILFDGFQAVARADIEGRVSGDLSLGGSYREPLAQGTLRVDQGTLFLEEFARSSEVVDLSDPRILEVVDTTALATRPILAGVRNPFLQNLRVDVDLSVPRDTWLRSNDMNVEMGGELLVAYDRTSRDLVLVGELEALRGSYVVLGRTFEVEGGTVGFIGTPGINPTLDIQAEARLPQPEGEPITVLATVEGNLTQPRVQLSSEEQGLAESELVSYLIFGTPSANLLTGSGQASWRQGQGFLGALAFSGVTYFSGTLANRLGSALAREVGVDYLNVTQVGNLAAGSGLAGTRIEVGQYISDEVFVVVVLSPTAEQGNRGVFSGARVEWSLSDPYTVEAFVEDRLLRSGIGGFNDLGFENWLVLGVFVFREWGY